MKENMSNLRNEYTGKFLDEKKVSADPLDQFEIWFKEALEGKVMEPNAMAMACVDTEGAPSVRMVLLKEFSKNGFTFFSNYTSKKGKDIEHNPRVSLLFFWPELARQIRIDGTVSKIDPQFSENYFKERPRESQISAWISQQSSEIESKAELERKFKEFESRHAKEEITYPVFWGGYILKPRSFEFWQGQANRLHDRVYYTYNNNHWKISRLAP